MAKHVRELVQNVRPGDPLSPDEIELTILMPCLNEAETINICVTKAAIFLEESGIKGEIVVADNGSSDGSQFIAEKFGARVVHIAERGYGAALRGGIQIARGRYIVMGDSDDTYDFSNLMPFLDRLRKGADLVVGNRFMGQIEPRAMPWIHRYVGNPALTFLGRLFFNIPIGDFHCGLRGFRTSAIRGLALQTTGMEFASEMIVRSALAGLSVQEAATTLAASGRSRAPHLRTWADGWRHLKFLLMYSPRWVFLLPGTAMTSLGALGAIALLFGPLPVSHNLILDLNTLIAACFLIVVGVQFLTLGAMAQQFATIAGFLPKTPRATLLFGWISTDRLLWIAAGLFIVGIVGFMWSVWQWLKIGFGPLNSPMVPRILVGSLSTLVIAIQTAGCAFLSGIMQIPFRQK